KARGKRPAHKPSVPTMASSGGDSVIKGAKQQVQRPGQRKHADAGNELKNHKGAPRPPLKEDPQFAETRAQLVREYIASIRTNQDCSHERWKTERPGGRCEMCHRDFRLYIFVSTEPEITGFITDMNFWIDMYGVPDFSM